VVVATYSGTIASPIGGFRDANGNLVDPTTITLIYRAATAAPVTLTYSGGGVIKDGVGLYHSVLDTTAIAGNWVYEWKGAGAVIAIAVNSFRTDEPPL
jgi:hypothetical protein